MSNERKKKPSERDKRRMDAAIGKNIRKERTVRGFTRAELSAMLGVTQGHLGLIERGERGANSVNLWKMSRIFEIPVDQFFTPLSQDADLIGQETDEESISNREKIHALVAYAEDSMLEHISYAVEGILKYSKS